MNDIIIAAVIQVSLIIWIVLSIKKRGDQTGFWNKEETEPARGIMALIIVIFHASYYLELLPEILWEMDWLVSIIIVALFSFFSAYGIERAMLQYGNTYFKRIVQKIAIIGLYSAGILILKHYIHQSIMWGGFAWIFTLILSYLISLISYKVFGESAYIFILIFWILYSILLWKYPSSIFGWQHQSLMYGFGALYGHFEDEVKTHIFSSNKRVVVASVINIVVLISVLCIYFFSVHNSNNPDIIQTEKSILVVLLCSLIIFLASYIKISNRLMAFLGTISLEIYMFHGIWLGLFYDNNFSGWVLVAATLISTVTSACIFHGIISIARTKWIQREQMK